MKKTTFDLLKYPVNEYRGKPFWAWNGLLGIPELLHQIDCFKEMGFSGFYMHSRSGLITEYLGKEWFDCIRACTEYASEIGMEPWIYDEDRWPSGTAGGIVARNDDYACRFISEYDSDEQALSAPEVKGIIARYAILFSGESISDARQIADKSECPAGYEYRVYAEELMENRDFYNGSKYIDVLAPEPVKEFLDFTFNKYVEHCGDLLGAKIKGVFQDEPQRAAVMTGFNITNKNHARMVPYTAGLLEKYKAMFGSELCLPEIYYLRAGSDVNNTARNYLELCHLLFEKNFGRQYVEYAHKLGLRTVGHVVEENQLSAQTDMGGDLMRYYTVLDIPGIDNLHRYSDAYWSVIQCASVARQFGKKYVMSELYGVTGWDMSLSEYKRIGDWQALFGINQRCPHLSWYTMYGEAKRDYPTSILDQNCWYKDWRILEDYFARLGYMLTEGERSCTLLAIYPIEDTWRAVKRGWMNAPFAPSQNTARLDKRYTDMCMSLIEAQVEFDLGNEGIMAEHASVGSDDIGAYIKVGECTYRQVFLLSDQTLRPSTHIIIDDFCALGGKVYGNAADIPRKGVVSAPQRVASRMRIIDGEPWLFMMNLSNVESVRGSVVLDSTLSALGAQEWDMTRCEPIGHVDLGDISFYPAQLRIFRLVGESECADTAACGESIELPELFDYELSEPNVLVLDRVSYSVGNSVGNDEVLRADRNIRKALGLCQRGGEALQPWYINKYCPQLNELAGTVKLSYEFFSERERDVMIAAEYDSISLNGKPLDRTEYRWVDNCFRVFSAHVKKGRNQITCTLDYSANSGVEAVYVLGDFGVELPNKLVELPKKLSTRNIPGQGLYFYGGAVTFYTDISGQNVFVQIKDLDGVDVHAIGGEHKVIAFAPYSATLQAGDGLKLTLQLSRRNTFGPLHYVAPRDTGIGPWTFVSRGDEWSEEVITVPYGFDFFVKKL